MGHIVSKNDKIYTYHIYVYDLRRIYKEFQLYLTSIQYVANAVLSVFRKVIM